MQKNNQLKVEIDNFDWIDICQPDRESLDKIANYFFCILFTVDICYRIYRINFDYMPEAKWQTAYSLTLDVMAVITIIIYIWFKQKRIP